MGARGSKEKPPGQGKKRVCIVGGGVAGAFHRAAAAASAAAATASQRAPRLATPPPPHPHPQPHPHAGMACAWSLSRFPERFEVEVWEALPETGGVASTCAVAAPEAGAAGDAAAAGCSRRAPVLINDQVQGGAPSYRNNLAFFREFGFEPHPVELRIAFGTGAAAWTNHSDSALAARLAPEIARFGRLLRWVYRLELVAAFVPIHRLLRWGGFSAEFQNEMVFPLTALFFGTGNQARARPRRRRWLLTGVGGEGGILIGPQPPQPALSSPSPPPPCLPLLCADAPRQLRRHRPRVPGPPAAVGARRGG